MSGPRTRQLALWLIGIIVLAGTVTAFVQSYEGLYSWSRRYLSEGWARTWPLQVDAWIAVGELALYLGYRDRWPRRRRIWPWIAALTGLAVSTGFNVGHLADADVAGQLTAAVPPVAAFGGLFLGLQVLKQVEEDDGRAKYAVAVDHGSSALVAGLLALGIGPGDEVIVPNMTWVASVSAVLRVGARPLLSDVDSTTGCVTWPNIEALLTSKTKAVIVVHLGCAIVDVAEIKAHLPKAVAIVEDCAQAHGAIHAGQRVGTHGAIGAFSFQQAKVLAAGEGGAVVTDDQDLYERVQELRADSRRYSQRPPDRGEDELVVSNGMCGANMCMSEIQAAILLDQLPRLEAQHRRRAENLATMMETLNRNCDAFGLPPLPRFDDVRSVYEVVLKYDRAAFGGAAPDVIARTVTDTVEFPIFAPDPPLTDHVMYRPERNPLYASTGATSESSAGPYPGVAGYCESTLLFHHSALLAPGSGERIGRGITRASEALRDR